jgi:hypothetical protein
MPSDYVISRVIFYIKDDHFATNWIVEIIFWLIKSNYPNCAGWIIRKKNDG